MTEGQQIEKRSKSTVRTGGIDLTGRLLFAVPKKGRLNEPTMSLLKGADLKFHRKNRLDIALCTNMPVAFVFLPASDIARFVGEGNVDLGITGMDVVMESGVEGKIEELVRLGFGKCRLCVQVPEDSGISSVHQVLGKRVVTSFEQLASTYFKQLASTSSSSSAEQTQVSYISGSVEAACSLGLADAIVDLVESGETMRAASLTDIATILQSEAILITKKWCSQTQQAQYEQFKPLIELITNRIKGVLAASNHVLVKYNIQKDKLGEATEITPGKCAPTISPLNNTEWLAVEAMISKSEEGHILDRLEQCGATDILVLEIKNCRV